MRKLHRWFGLLASLVLLFVAVTGLLSQVGSLVNNGGFKEEVAETGARQTAAIGFTLLPEASAHRGEDAAVQPAVTAAADGKAGFVCPADMTCRPKRPPQAWDVGFLHHLHSGEEFGPAGVILSMAGGIALIFFALSGLWMYAQMYRARARSGRKGWFW